MRNRVVFVVMALWSASASATIHKHRHARTVLALRDQDASSGNQGAKMDSAVAVPPLTRVFPTFVEFHSARVENDLILFPLALGSSTPQMRTRTRLCVKSPARKARFFTPAPVADDLEVRREHDRLLLFRGPQPQGASVGLGVAMFGTATILSAHLPAPFRILFDRPVHLGPAVFDGGGMGAGIAGHGL